MITESIDFPEIRNADDLVMEVPAVNQIQLDANPVDGEGVQVDGNLSVFCHGQIKKGDNLRFTPGNSEEQLVGKVLSRAGKVGGVNEFWWNIQTDDGEQRSYDTSRFSSVEKISEATQPQIETAFVVQIPRYLHSEPKCVEAKQKELSCWDEFHVYDEVKDEG